MTFVEITEATATPEIGECYAIRREVFCIEQKVSSDIEFDGLDDLCRHYLARADGIAVGTARLRPLSESTVKFERIAVLIGSRRTGIGSLLMERALKDAAGDGLASGILHAQSHAGAFYEKMGFLRDGPEFMEANIPHIRMTKTF